MSKQPTVKELLARIDKLEARVKELEARNVLHIHHHQEPVGIPYRETPQPFPVNPTFPWTTFPPTTCGGHHQ